MTPAVRRAPAQQRFYDGGVAQFSPDGTLYQVEYARRAVDRAELAMAAVVSPDQDVDDNSNQTGIVVAARVRSHIPKRLRATDGTHRKLHRIDSHIACAVAGVTPDALVLVKMARRSAQEYRQLWGEPIPISLLVRQVCNHKQACTQYGGQRPFGAALLFAGWDEIKGFQIYKTDPSGSFETATCSEGVCTSIAVIGGGDSADSPSLCSKFQDRVRDIDQTEDAVAIAVNLLSAPDTEESGGDGSSMTTSDVEALLVTTRVKSNSPMRVTHGQARPHQDGISAHVKFQLLL